MPSINPFELEILIQKSLKSKIPEKYVEGDACPLKHKLRMMQKVKGSKLGPHLAFTAVDL